MVHNSLCMLYLSENLLKLDRTTIKKLVLCLNDNELGKNDINILYLK